MKRRILQGFVFGMISGLILGFFLKGVQAQTGSKVYTLLLNIDFAPGLPDQLPEWIEFSLHLIVAIVLGIIYRILLTRWLYPWRIGLLIGAASSLLFFPLALLSDRVPEISDMTAYMYWLAGHILYGAVLGLLGYMALRRTSSSLPRQH